MPQWLSNQLMRAFHKRDRKQIQLLNDCWFHYRSTQKKTPAPSMKGARNPLS
ncbi:cortex morphogenetic protein CmpA [Paenibacillus massiliensis]|uniref:cortex morphogenetic protein CmpA n=1 Tax=Paenibacillus massiliensis TaxID=225917 RepID=UPI00105B7811|nr:cortex morphogenetic protein CmpA [Paenibacillus massiliensis]